MKSSRLSSLSLLALALALALPCPEAGASEGSPDGSRRAPVEAALPGDAATLARAVVLPFTPIGESEPDYLSEGITAFLTEAIGVAGHPVVGTEERLAAIEAAGLAGEPHLTLASTCVIARSLGAHHLVTGTWEAKGTALTVEARVIDVDALRTVTRTRSVKGVHQLGRLLADVALALLGDSARPAEARQAVERLANAPQAGIIAWMQAAAEPDLAPSHLGAAVEAAPALAAARLDLAEALLDGGQPEKVAVVLDRIVPPLALRDEARASALRGRVSLAFGDTANAVRLLREAVARSADRDALLWLGEAQLAAGDAAGAAGSAERVLLIAPSDGAAADLLERARPNG